MPPRLRRYYGAGYLHFITTSGLSQRHRYRFESNRCVILSGVTASRSEAAAESKDPTLSNPPGRLREFSPRSLTNSLRQSTSPRETRIGGGARSLALEQLSPLRLRRIRPSVSQRTEKSRTQNPSAGRRLKPCLPPFDCAQGRHLRKPRRVGQPVVVLFGKHGERWASPLRTSD
jgi:hypothetical protein